MEGSSLAPFFYFIKACKLINDDLKYIQRTFELAQKGRGKVSPNPMVGCVLVLNDQVIGEGFHHKYGDDHAEVDAIKNSNINVEGATLYSNLEPCCHKDKKTPPCTDLIIKKKIARVVISNLDPNPHVAGRGVQVLEEAGIEVVVGVGKEEGVFLNQAFFKFIQKEQPHVTLKIAQTLDGKIFIDGEKERWISDKDARNEVHHLRDGVDAILVGSNTIKKDNPSLTVRVEGLEERSIKRVILGSIVENWSNYKVFNDEFCKDTICAIPAADLEKIEEPVFEKMIKKGVHFLEVKKGEDSIDLEDLLNKLGEFKISSLLVEGGGRTAGEFIAQKKVDKSIIYVAPFYGLSGVNISSTTKESNIESLKNVKVRQLNDQAVIEGYFNVYGNC